MAENANITLRTDVRAGDLGRVLSLHAFYANEYGFDLTFEGYIAGTLARFSNPIDPSRERLWLAEVGERLIGCIAIVKQSEQVDEAGRVEEMFRERKPVLR